MKRPSFQFYPSDWLRDTALRSCSTGARGLWIDMICFMHEGNPYGYLKVADKVILPANLARMVGETLEVVQGWLDELNHAGVFQVDENGAIFSKRMIRDENLRKIRAEGGSKGGNPALIDKSKVNLKVIQEVKQNPTPSSSSSSSSSVNNTNALFDEFWQAYPKHKGKINAQKAFAKLKPSEDLLKEMISAIEIQSSSEDWKKENGQFIPYPATWLSQGRWMDEVVPAKQTNRFAGDL